MSGQRVVSMGSDERTPLIDFVAQDVVRRGFTPVLHGALKEGEDANWPVVAERVAREVAEGRAGQGILFCWTGTGVSMAANKVGGIRAALCNDAGTAAGARRWNDANVLCLSLRLVSQEVAREVLDAWFSNQPEESERANINRVGEIERRRLLSQRPG